MLKLYRAVTFLASPLMPLYIGRRRGKGKEDTERLRERFGIASIERPAGAMLWLHAASVGEANSLLLLIARIHEKYPDLRMLLTTGTVTSAQLMASKLPSHVMHQFVPIDTPKAARLFMKYWRPDVVLFTESELWPNLLSEAKTSGAVLGIVNARMSAKSAKRWAKVRSSSVKLLSNFSLVLAQTEADAQRFSALGAPSVEYAGNLKYDTPSLVVDGAAMLSMQRDIGARRVWLAASTHPGEEAMIAQVHRALNIPNLLTIIVPRHAHRGANIRDLLTQQGFSVQLRSVQEPLRGDTEIYVADTMGELGLFYTLSPIVFIGGSLVEHGGQNLLEAAKFECALLSGPHMYNFAEAVSNLQHDDAMWMVRDTYQLTQAVKELFDNEAQREALAGRAKQSVTQQRGITARVMRALSPLIEEGMRHAARS